jgi:Transglycosylase SLT domain
MKSVARKMGLQVNKHVDERKDLDKSAHAAAKLIRTICIPYTNAMLGEFCIDYNASDWWYRMLVLHSYHAGAGNVKKALQAINPCPEDDGAELLQKLWVTKAGGFGIASQNYSQVALACTFRMYDIIHNRCEEIFWVE